MRVKGSSGTVLLDGQTVTIRRASVWERMQAGSWSKIERRLLVSQISAVHIKEPTTVSGIGFIEFAVPDDARRSPTSSASDENTVLFTRKHLPGFLALREAIELARTAPPRLWSAPPAIVPGSPPPRASGRDGERGMA